MLTAIGLSISSACEADCLYCPSNRGSRIREKMMPLALVQRIVDELASDSFRAHHAVREVTVSENGDAFLNRHLVEQLEYIHRKLPEAQVICYTSFRRCSPTHSRAILEEHLVDGFVCTMNGHGVESFEATKHVNYAAVRANLLAFLDLRRELGGRTSLAIQVITARQYVDAVHRSLGTYPVKLDDRAKIRVPDDYAAIRREWMPRLDPARDGLFRSGTFGWAERERAKGRPLDESQLACPQLERVKQAAFIAPDGSWYACCLDANNDLVVGNVNEQSLDEIYNGASRRELIDRLERRRFLEIGGPCATVNACQVLDQGFDMKAAVKSVAGPAMSARLARLVRGARVLRRRIVEGIG
jgi:hypothetical protein